MSLCRSFVALARFAHLHRIRIGQRSDNLASQLFVCSLILHVSAYQGRDDRWQGSEEHHEGWSRKSPTENVADPDQVKQKGKGTGKRTREERKEQKREDRKERKRQRSLSEKRSKWKDFCDSGKDSDDDAEEDVQESSAGASGSAAPAPKKEEQHAKSLMCCDCEEDGTRFTLATLCVRDWEGTLVCICRRCYNLNPRPLPKIEVATAPSGDGASTGKGRSRANDDDEPPMDFEEFQRRSWNLRKKNTRAACRVLGFKKANKEIEKEANESLRSYKKRLFGAARRLALGLVSSFERMSDTQRKEAEEAWDWWAGEQAAIARNPDHVPPNVAPMALLPASAAQYLATITDTLSEFYLCRKLELYDSFLVASGRPLRRHVFLILVASGRPLR